LISHDSQAHPTYHLQRNSATIDQKRELNFETGNYYLLSILLFLSFYLSFFFVFDWEGKAEGLTSQQKLGVMALKG
jgi:hypothetical protein